MHEFPRLHVITPPDPAATDFEAMQAVLAAGAPLIQVRTKDVSDRSRFTRASSLVGQCHALGAVAIINDRADVAAATGADGVHVGHDDLPPDAVRSVLGAEAVIGATARDPDAARRARDSGATYLGVGPIYATSTKTGLPAPIGLAGLEAVARAVDLPVIAIAGVQPKQVPELLEAGAWGVAAIGAVFDAADPATVVHQFLERLP
jgi:thiamine-phosphate pyrophosphorylase